MPGKERMRAHFSGTVQGVGFRYTTLHVARGFSVTGTVRNLPDGRVELIAEGESGELSGFRAAVEQAMIGTIAGVKEERSQATGEFRDFRIAR